MNYIIFGGCGKKLASTDYQIHYIFKESIKDWYEECGKEGLV